jgi:light-regulated signal transduction histidine kinase (bacteriophytochrome)
MNDVTQSLVKPDAYSRGLAETVRRSLSHDVRTPLGTIVNYASVLESIEHPQAAEVRALSRKVRDNAMRAASMLQQISDAVTVLTQNERVKEFDVAPLLDHCLQASISGRAIDVSPQNALPPLRGHVAMLEFLWKAVFRFDSEMRGRTLDRVEYEASTTSGELHLKVWLGPRAAGPQQPLLEPARLLRDEGARIATETRMAFELALGLLESSGGRVTIRGKPGGACEVELSVAIAA